MRLDRINEVLNQKLEKYKHECAIQADDREFLVRQLVAIKKENSRLRREIEKIKSVMSFHIRMCMYYGAVPASLGDSSQEEAFHR